MAKKNVKARRKIIKIDEDKCDGCGLCVPACHEGALKIVDGKVRLVKESYCDALGDCLGECPRGAISFEEREAEAYDEAATKKHVAKLEKAEQRAPAAHGGGGCPGASLRSWGTDSPVVANDQRPTTAAKPFRRLPPCASGPYRYHWCRSVPLTLRTPTF